MIAVFVGTSPLHFSRLLAAVDHWAKASGESVVAQCGYTPTDNLNIHCESFVDHSVITKWIGEADILISHGGIGTLRDCIRSGKPTIAVPRLLKLNETKADQTQLVKELADQNLVIELSDIAQLSDAITKAKERGLLPQTGIVTSDVPDLVANFVSAKLGGI